MRRKLLADADIGVPQPQPGRVFHAGVLHDTLVIDIYDDNEKVMRHLYNRKDYDTLICSATTIDGRYYLAGTWSKMKATTILNGSSYYYCTGQKNKKISSESEKTILDYMCEPKHRYSGERWYSILEDFENDIAYEKRELYEYNKLKRLNDIMAAVPVLAGTEEWNNWIDGVYEKYIFAKAVPTKIGYRYSCTMCKQNYYSKIKPKHDTTVVCSKCGQGGRLKTRTNEIFEHKTVLAVSIDGNAMILRHYYTHCISESSKRLPSHRIAPAQRIIGATERMRVIVEDGKTTKIYYGDNHNSNVSEEKQEWTYKRHNTYTQTKYIVCPVGLENISNTSVRETLRIASYKRIEADWNKFVWRRYELKQMEYLLKSGLYNVAKDILDNYSIWSGFNNDVNIKATTAWEYLGIDKQRMYRIRDMNGNMYACRALRAEKNTNEKVSQEVLEYIDKNKIAIKKLEIDRTGLTINRAIGYIRRQMVINSMSFSEVLDYYTDYLQMAAERGMNLEDDVVRITPKLKYYHDKYLEEKNAAEDENNAKEKDEKYPNIKANYEINNMLFAWNDSQYSVLVPSCAKDIVLEGRKQHHCVAASTTYFERMNNGESYILFLRKNEDPETPWYTLEVQMKNNKIEIKQWYAAYDRKPEAEETEKVLKKWKRAVEKRAKEKEKCVS